ncbi:MAG: hypothetical protein HS130_12905 [Deltaproteobacteria bacterium]|nr:hypothetical protein [Deltaproteobacteria bacterium]MCL4873425.1 hypothetical protein [bacterium]
MDDNNCKKALSGPDNKAMARTSRRGFLSKAVVAGVAVAATAGLAKKTGDLIFKEDHQKAYIDDLTQGDSVLASRQYIVMTKEEKRDLLKSLFEFHKNPVA